MMMIYDAQFQLALLLVTGLFVWLWRLAGRRRHALLPIDALQRRVPIGSAETIRHVESELPLRRLPFDLDRPGMLVERVSLVALYLLLLVILLR